MLYIEMRQQQKIDNNLTIFFTNLGTTSDYNVVFHITIENTLIHINNVLYTLIHCTIILMFFMPNIYMLGI